MDFLQAVILGVIQGLTEFLPISSSAHISFFGQLMLGQGVAGDGSPGFTAFTAIIQIGTELAILLYFLGDIVRILRAWGSTLTIALKHGPNRATSQLIGQDAKMGWLIILGTIPIVVAGVVLKTPIETIFRPLWLTAVMLIVVGVIMVVVDTRADKTQAGQALGESQLHSKNALLYGLAQCAALIPGVSRSGATITAGRALGFDRASAARFSFYLAIPSVFGAALLELKSALGDVGDAGFPGWGATVVATVVSFAVGYIVIAAFMKMISHVTLRGFAIYRVLLGGIILVLVIAGVVV